MSFDDNCSMCGVSLIAFDDQWVYLGDVPVCIPCMVVTIERLHAELASVRAELVEAQSVALELAKGVMYAPLGSSLPSAYEKAMSYLAASEAAKMKENKEIQNEIKLL